MDFMRRAKDNQKEKAVQEAKCLLKEIQSMEFEEDALHGLDQDESSRRLLGGGGAPTASASASAEQLAAAQLQAEALLGSAFSSSAAVGTATTASRKRGTSDKKTDAAVVPSAMANPWLLSSSTNATKTNVPSTTIPISINNDNQMSSATVVRAHTGSKEDEVVNNTHRSIDDPKKAKKNKTSQNSTTSNNNTSSHSVAAAPVSTTHSINSTSFVAPSTTSRPIVLPPPPKVVNSVKKSLLDHPKSQVCLDSYVDTTRHDNINIYNCHIIVYIINCKYYNTQLELVSLAFSGPDLEAQFAALKKKAVNDELGVDDRHKKILSEGSLCQCTIIMCLRLVKQIHHLNSFVNTFMFGCACMCVADKPGWGMSWAGMGATNGGISDQVVKKRKVLLQKAEEHEAGLRAGRRDGQLANVILSDRRIKTAAKYKIAEIPHPFTTREEYERSLQMPLGGIPSWLLYLSYHKHQKCYLNLNH